MTLTQVLRVTRVDIAERLQHRIAQGHLTSTVGIGATADITLLDDDLKAAAVSLLNREIEIVSVRLVPKKGCWTVARGGANFGVYYDGGEGILQVEREMRLTGLAPGDRIGLGSCPADAVWFSLPEVRGVRMSQRAERQTVDQHKVTYEPTLQTALLHWSYAEITISAAEDAVVRIRDPELEGLRISLHRDIADPSRGLRISVHSTRIPVFTATWGSDQFMRLERGEERTLQGSGNHLRFGRDQQVKLPAPCIPVGRFAGRDRPITSDLLAVFELNAAQLNEPNVVKHRYRELMRRLHPDRNGDHPGHTSRFLEVQACWKRYQELRS